MTVARARRTLMERLLAPESVAVFGADTAEGARVLANLHQGGFSGTILEVPPRLPPDLAILASTGARAAADLAALHMAGGRAAIVVSHIAELGALAAAHGVRVMGPSSFGLAVPRLGLNASLSHIAVPAGNIALVTQSASLARAVVDWAGPNGVGFSHVVGIGANLSVGIGANLSVGIGANLTAVAGADQSDDTGANLSVGIGANLSAGIGANLSAVAGADQSDDTGANLSAGIGANLSAGIGADLSARADADRSDDIGGNLGSGIDGNLRAGTSARLSHGDAAGLGLEDGVNPGAWIGAAAGAGAGAGLGFGAVLDVLSRDPGTRLILLDIRRVRDRRAFISAARAASRLRPVVALRPGSLLLDPSGRSDAVFEAALARAGVLLVRQMDSFLAAAETVSRARKLLGTSMAVITNAIGPGRLAADAALRAGIGLAVLPAASQQALTASLPAELTQGLIYAGSAAPTDIASIAAMVSAVPEVGGVLVLLSPTGPGDAAAVAAVIAAAQTARLPVLTCVMGETTAAAHRRRLAEAGLPVFATPEQAVRAFALLLAHRAARLSALELPSNQVLDIAPDHEAASGILADCRAREARELTAAEALGLLACYGLRASCIRPAADSAAPGVAASGFTRPDLTRPDLTQADLAPADLAQPDFARPDLAQPGIARPDFARPDLAQPDIARPDFATPDFAMPDLARPDFARPDLPRPDLARPDFATPDLVQPNLARPELARPDLARPAPSPADLPPEPDTPGPARLTSTPPPAPPVPLHPGTTPRRSAPQLSALRITVHDDPTFGPTIGVAGPPDAAPAYDLPPLNLALAHALAARAGFADPVLAAACANALVRISQMVVDLPELDRLELAGLVCQPDNVVDVGSAAVGLRGAGERARLAITPYPNHLTERWSSGGQTFTIRPIRPEDAAAHADLIARVPPDDLRYRFFTAVREVSPEQMARLTQIDYDREMAFVAVRDADQATVGVARLVCEAAGQSGEFAILVEPDSKGLGLARRLMQRLVAWARAQGIPTITGQVLADNQPMLGFVRHLGFELRHLPDEADVVEVVLHLGRAVVL